MPEHIGGSTKSKHKKALEAAEIHPTRNSHDLVRGNAMIQFFHGVDPATLNENQWAERFHGIMHSLSIVRKVIWGEEKSS